MGKYALTADWSCCPNYAFPTLAILDRVIALIHRQRARTLLVALVWPSAIWWPALLDLSPQLVVLPRSTSPFLPQQSGCHHPLGKGFHRPDVVQFAAFWITFDSPQVCRLGHLHSTLFSVCT